jgi:hypothetical protein
LKNKIYVKLVLDVIMYVIFVLLMKIGFGGIAFHEIAGIGIGFVFLVHILLNLQWIKKVTLKLFDRKLPGKIRFGYLLNLLLLITIIFIIVSGILISKVVFPELRFGNERWFQMAHILVSYISLILVGIHIGLHWQWITYQVKKIFKVKASKIAGNLAKMAIILLLVFGAYQIVTTQFSSRIASIGTLFNTSSQQAPSEELRSREHSFGEHGSIEGDFRKPLPPENSSSIEGNSSEIPRHPDGFSESREKGDFRSSNPLGNIAIFSGIIGFITVITYYLDRLFTRIKLSKS